MTKSHPSDHYALAGEVRRLLGRDDLTDDERRKLVLLADRALSTAPPERRPMWKRIVEALDRGNRVGFSTFPAEFRVADDPAERAEVDLFARLEEEMDE
jgi:hypothetical protein